MFPAYLVAGLAFGDEGKGATVDALVRRFGANMVIRYNGGAQCAHNVVSPDGKHHTFAQFGAGTFVPGVRTYLSRFVLVNPVSLMIEEENLRQVGVTDAFDRLYVDRQAVVITPYQRSLNRLQELSRGKQRHGSTGMGIGVAREDHLKYGDSVLMVRDLCNPKTAKDKLEWSRTLCKERAAALTLDGSNMSMQQELGCLYSPTTTFWYLDKYAQFCRRVMMAYEPPSQYSRLVFEGAQGMMLDETHGLQPHTTWSDITFHNADVLLNEMSFMGDIHRVGVLRAYYTRHGAGPLPSEDRELQREINTVEIHNKGEEYTGAFRVGAFDIGLALYGLHCISGVDSLAINHVDVINGLGYAPVRLPSGEMTRWGVARFLNELPDILETPISMIGEGLSFEDREFYPENLN